MVYTHTGCNRQPTPARSRLKHGESSSLRTARLVSYCSDVPPPHCPRSNSILQYIGDFRTHARVCACGDVDLDVPRLVGLVSPSTIRSRCSIWPRLHPPNCSTTRRSAVSPAPRPRHCRACAHNLVVAIHSAPMFQSCTWGIWLAASELIPPHNTPSSGLCQCQHRDHVDNREPEPAGRGRHSERAGRKAARQLYVPGREQGQVPGDVAITAGVGQHHIQLGEVPSLAAST